MKVPVLYPNNSPASTVISVSEEFNNQTLKSFVTQVFNLSQMGGVDDPINLTDAAQIR